MSKNTITIILFTCFAFGLPIWAMQTNEYDNPSVHGCSGECYRQWQEQTGGVLALNEARAQAKAAASPAELGEMAYAGCVACHGAQGQGGIGPQLAGQPATAVTAMLLQYKNGETRGAQSALMWSQAGQLSEADIDNLAAFIATL
jgi:cytochrome c553